MALELAQDARDGEAGEPGAALGVEAVDGIDQPDARDLLEILQRHRLASVAVRQAMRQGQEALDQLSPGRRIAEADVAQEQAPLAVRVVPSSAPRAVLPSDARPVAGSSARRAVVLCGA